MISLAGYDKGRMCLQQEVDGGCLELFIAFFLIGRQSSGHKMHGFNINCSSAGVVAVWRRLTCSARDKGLLCLQSLRVGVVRIFFPIIFSFLSASLWDGWMTCDLTSCSTEFQLYQDDE